MDGAMSCPAGTPFPGSAAGCAQAPFLTAYLCCAAGVLAPCLAHPSPAMALDIGPTLLAQLGHPGAEPLLGRKLPCLQCHLPFPYVVGLAAPWEVSLSCLNQGIYLWAISSGEVKQDKFHSHSLQNNWTSQACSDNFFFFLFCGWLYKASTLGLLPTDQESKPTQEIRSLLTFALGLAWKKPFLQHTSNLSQKTVPHCI